MEPDEALSYALKRLAEDVLRECDLSIASAEVPKKYAESQIFGTVSTNLRKSSSHNIQENKGALLSEELNQYVGAECPHIKDEVVVSGDPNSLIQKNVDFPSVHNKGLCCFRGEELTIGSEELKKDSIDLAEPPPNIDPHDPSYCAIKQAFTRCLNQIQELKTKLALAVQEISQLRQEQVLSETGQVFPVCRDIATETEEELLTPVFIKEESNVCTNIRSDNEEKIESEALQNSGEDSNIFDSISAVVIQRRGRRKRTNVWKVTEQNLDDVSDVDEDNSDDNFMGDGGVSSNDNEENEAKPENSPNSADDNIKTNSISPPSLRLSPRKVASGKQTKPKKKKKSGFHACDICFKSYGRAIDLRKHKLTHARNANNDYECEICKATFKRYAEIEKHSRIHRAPAIKSEPTSFPCSLPLCDKVLPDRLALKRHKKSHPKSCPVCNVSISCKNYSTHLRGHTGEKPYKCKQCTMSFIGPRHLARHVRVHTGEKPYSCTVCNKSFSEAGALRTHIRRHTGERPYVCETCGKAFAQLTGLTYHIRTHTGEKPYQCDLCSKSFAQVTGLENHKRTHTGEKPYCCDICGRCFAVAITFTQHKRTHTGERPYKCDVCSRAFTTGGALHRHKVIHAGVKPHICVVCGVAFARLGDLQRHVRTHTGIRPYKCDTCGKAFSRRSHLQAHGKTHVDKVNLRPRAKAHVPSSTSQGINRQTERYIERPIETGMERQLEQSLEPEQALLEQGGMNPVHVRALTSEASPMYLGLGARGPQDMSYPNRSVFPDRTPAAGERHTMTPDSTTVYQERGGIGQERGPPGDPRVRPAPDQDRVGTVHERPANLQEFMPALPHHQMNIPPGVYPQWNFSFQ